MIRGFLKTAAAAAAIAALPASAIAASPAASLSVAGSTAAAIAVQDDEDDGPFANLSRYAIPIVIVLVIGLAFYFVLDDDEGDSISA